MKKAFCCLCSLFLCTAIHAQLSVSDEKYMDSLMLHAYPDNQPGAVLLIAKDGKPVFRKAYGMGDAELQTPNKPEYLFQTGALSMQFTAVCILQLAEAGKLSLTEDISKYIPDFRNSHKITIENLLTHTSGLPNFDESTDLHNQAAFELGRDYTQAELVHRLNQDSLFFKPGSQFTYSGSGYYLLALVVEKLSKQPFHTYVEEHIFKKLGMDHSYLGCSGCFIPGFTKGYTLNSDDNLAGQASFSWSSLMGSGSLVTNVDDLLKWDEALYNSSLVSKKWLDKAFTAYRLPDAKLTNYGYGWGIDDFKGVHFQFHGGTSPGFLANGLRLPLSHTCVYLLSNNARSDIKSLSNRIALKLMNKTLPKPWAYKPAVRNLKEAEGVYQIDRIGVRLISSFTTFSNEKRYELIFPVNDTLYHQEPEGVKSMLMPVEKDLFVTGSGKYYQFKRNYQQEIYEVIKADLPLTLGPPSERLKTKVPSPLLRKNMELSEADLQKMTGTWSLGTDGNFEILLNGGKLLLQFPDNPPVELSPLGSNLLLSKDLYVDLEFGDEKDGHFNEAVIKGIQDHKALRVKK
ncbi:MAG TPA: serine hydrolase domain-containing protein [Bacteroidia bacterium]|nr:serine hydrolase domain-containing protein [Bacteroidia bacterium]